MKKLSNPKDLVVAQLSELLWVERRLAFDVLPEVIGAVHDRDLKTLLEEHHEQTKGHVARVEQAFKEIGMEPSSAFSPAASALFDHHDEVAAKIVQPALADRWHAASAIATEHTELALYAGLLPLLSADVRKLLDANNRDEAAALKRVERWLEDAKEVRDA